MTDPGGRVVLMMAPSADVAERIVQALVDERLAACGSILPGATSIYRWQGEIQRDAEVFVMLKTHEDQTDALVRRAAELHPYDVPELLALRVERGLASYLQWLESSTGANT